MTTAETRAPTRAVLPAGAVLAGTLVSLIGLTWDVEWHDDVGPDTFFTLPHLFLYSGSAICGLVSLAVVLSVTGAQRAGRAVDPRLGGPGVRVLRGTFTAPVGYLLAGAGGASFLLYGLWDLWWHDVYGFDAVIDSPPHIGLLLSVLVTAVGGITVFVAAGPARRAVVGAVVALAVALAFSTVVVLGLSSLGPEAVGAGTAFLSVLLVLTARAALARAGAAIAVAAAVAAWQAFSWWFSPAAAVWYAGVVGLPLRDNAVALPSMPTLIPMVLLPAAAAAELVWWWGTSAPRRAAPVAGALAGLLIGAAAPVQDALLYGVALLDPVAHGTIALVGALAGAGAGLLALRLGEMLRLVAGGAR